MARLKEWIGYSLENRRYLNKSVTSGISDSSVDLQI